MLFRGYFLKRFRKYPLFALKDYCFYLFYKAYPEIFRSVGGKLLLSWENIWGKYGKYFVAKEVAKNINSDII